VKTTFQEAKSRHITPAQSAFDFQIGDGLLIKDGENVRRKLVRSIELPNKLTVCDPDGSGEETVTLNSESPERDASGEFKYWIDEGTMAQSHMHEEFDDDFDDPLDDAGDDDSLYGEDDDLEVELGDEDDFNEDDFNEDLRSFLGEDGSQVPDDTVGGSVSSEQDDNDGEGVEDTPPPNDTTGIETAGDVQTMAGDSSSNVPGSAPTDEVSTHGSVGGDPTIDSTLPQNDEHEPGEPDDAEGESSATESVREDVDTAISLVQRASDRDTLAKKLAPRLLRGA